MKIFFKTSIIKLFFCMVIILSISTTASAGLFENLNDDQRSIYNYLPPRSKIDLETFYASSVMQARRVTRNFEKEHFNNFLHAIVLFSDSEPDEVLKLGKAYVIGFYKIKDDSYAVNLNHLLKFFPRSKSMVNSYFWRNGLKVSKKNNMNILKSTFSFCLSDYQISKWSILEKSNPSDQIFNKSMKPLSVKNLNSSSGECSKSIDYASLSFNFYKPLEESIDELFIKNRPTYNFLDMEFFEDDFDDECNYFLTIK